MIYEEWIKVTERNLADLLANRITLDEARKRYATALAKSRSEAAQAYISLGDDNPFIEYLTDRNPPVTKPRVRLV